MSAKPVIPAQAGIQNALGPRLRGDDAHEALGPRLRGDDAHEALGPRLRGDDAGRGIQ
jgi:hypothetical protein